MNGHSTADFDPSEREYQAQQIAAQGREHDRERMESMGLTRSLSKQGEFELHPEGGPFAAVCVDMQYMGIVETQFGDKEKIRYIFLTSETMQGGKPFWVSHMMNLTLSANKGKESTLYKFLLAWLGKPPVTENAPAFDFASMIGKGCLLTIVHSDGKNGQTYANINTITPLMKGQHAPDTAGYERRYDKDGLPLDQEKRREFLSKQAGFAEPATAPSDADETVIDGDLDDIASIPF